MSQNQTNEYRIPGLEDVGIPGKRKPINPQKISEVIDVYTAGKGAMIDTNGTLVTQKDARNFNPDQLSQLQNISTSMANNSLHPYHSANQRRDALMPPLAEMRVTVVGLGGGAPIPVELAKCGVEKFTFFDMDVLSLENLIRHPCGIEYIHLPKVDAVSQYLKRQSGQKLSIAQYAEDIFTSMHLRAEIAKSDLLIVATDTEASRFFLNEISVELGVPTIFVGMFEGGTGGEIFAAVPGEGCYCCLAEHIGRKHFINTYVKATRKGDCSSTRDTSAMPGLGVDQGILCHIATRKALDILLKNKNHKLPPVGKNWIVFSICGITNVLSDSLTSIQMDIPKHASCMTCHE
ncbi:MAG: ThiF family adenylyltransferase [Candidatus Gracilibacteria bacterium]|nr:ThiF family adenylyltransferase [Candidatus Gracilibacteria bacterium]